MSIIKHETEYVPNVLTTAALAVSCKDSDVRQVRALVLGPPESPYQFGFYEVRLPSQPKPITD